MIQRHLHFCFDEIEVFWSIYLQGKSLQITTSDRYFFYSGICRACLFPLQNCLNFSGPWMTEPINLNIGNNYGSQISLAQMQGWLWLRSLYSHQLASGSVLISNSTGKFHLRLCGIEQHVMSEFGRRKLRMSYQ